MLAEVFERSIFGQERPGFAAISGGARRTEGLLVVAVPTRHQHFHGQRQQRAVADKQHLVLARHHVGHRRDEIPIQRVKRGRIYVTQEQYRLTGRHFLHGAAQSQNTPGHIVALDRQIGQLEALARHRKYRHLVWQQHIREQNLAGLEQLLLQISERHRTRIGQLLKTRVALPQLVFDDLELLLRALQLAGQFRTARFGIGKRGRHRDQGLALAVDALPQLVAPVAQQQESGRVGKTRHIRLAHHFGKYAALVARGDFEHLPVKATLGRAAMQFEQQPYGLAVNVTKLPDEGLARLIGQAARARIQRVQRFHRLAIKRQRLAVTPALGQREPEAAGVEQQNARVAGAACRFHRLDVDRLGIDQLALPIERQGQRGKGRRRVRMQGPERAFENIHGAALHRLRFAVAAALVEQGAKVGQGVGKSRMVRPEYRLLDVQGAPIQVLHLGCDGAGRARRALRRGEHLRVLVLLLKGVGEVVKAGRGVGVRRTQHFFARRQNLAMQHLGIGGPALQEQHVGQVGATGQGLRMLRAERALQNKHHARL